MLKNAVRLSIAGFSTRFKTNASPKTACLISIAYYAHVKDINELVTKSKGPKHDYCNKGKNNKKKVYTKSKYSKKKCGYCSKATIWNKNVPRRNVT